MPFLSSDKCPSTPACLTSVLLDGGTRGSLCLLLLFLRRCLSLSETTSPRDHWHCNGGCCCPRHVLLMIQTHPLVWVLQQKDGGTVGKNSATQDTAGRSARSTNLRVFKRPSMIPCTNSFARTCVVFSPTQSRISCYSGCADVELCATSYGSSITDVPIPIWQLAGVFVLMGLVLIWTAVLFSIPVACVWVKAMPYIRPLPGTPTTNACWLGRVWRCGGKRAGGSWERTFFCLFCPKECLSNE